MVRILHVVHALTRGGGLSNFIMNYYRKMDHTKVQFDFIYFKEVPNDFKDEITSLGGRYYKWTEPGMNFKYIKEANEFFDQHRGEYIAIHCHALFALPLFGGIAKKHGINHVIAHSHNVGYGENGLVRKVRNFIFVRMCRTLGTEKLACSVNAAKFMFGDKAYKNGEVIIVENAVDCEKYFFEESTRDNIRKELNLSNKYVIGHVGGFAKQKNHEFLVELFYEFQKNHENSVLLLVGGDGIASGSTMQTIKEKISNLGISEKVIFTGIRSDVNSVMMGMDLFVFPSIFEGFGLVLVEAQASGLMCLASECIPHDAKCTDNVMFLPLEDKKAWLDSMDLIYNMENKRTIDHGQFDCYNINYNAKRLEQFYLSLS